MFNTFNSCLQKKKKDENNKEHLEHKRHRNFNLEIKMNIISH
jgi:hypothetical protein